LSVLNLQPSTFSEFEREAARGNVVPVVRGVLADLQTPVGALLRLAGDSPYSFLLESVEGGERVARYSFVGAAPEMVVRGRGRETIIERAGGTEARRLRATDFLREHLRGLRLAERADLPPLAGGAVGYLSYEAARWFEPVLKMNFTQDARADDAAWMFYRTVLAFDRVRQRIEIVSVVLTEEAGQSRARLKELYERAVEETARVERVLLGTPPPTPQHAGEAERGDVPGRFTSNFTRDDFESAVRIANGSPTSRSSSSRAIGSAAYGPGDAVVTSMQPSASASSCAIP
jgi:anthranilate synthase component 1